jgi:hypothetical protein
MVRAKAAEFETKDTGHDAWWLLRQADRGAKYSELGKMKQQESEAWKRHSQWAYEYHMLGRVHGDWKSSTDDWTKVREHILAKFGYGKVISK